MPSPKNPAPSQPLQEINPWLFWLEGCGWFALFIVLNVIQGMLLGWGILTTILLIGEAFAVFSRLYSRGSRQKTGLLLFIAMVVLTYAGYFTYQWVWTQTTLNFTPPIRIQSARETVTSPKPRLSIPPILLFETAKPNLRYQSEYRHDFKNSHQYYALAPVTEPDWDPSQPVQVWAFVDLRNYTADLLKDPNRLGLAIQKPSLYHQKAVTANLQGYKLINGPNPVMVEWLNPRLKLRHASQMVIASLLVLVCGWMMFIIWSGWAGKKKKEKK